MNISDIDAMAEALAKQCGMRCSVHKAWEGDKLDNLYVQIRLHPLADSHDESAWRFIHARNEEELTRVRDEMVAFIQQHKQEAA